MLVDTHCHINSLSPAERGDFLRLAGPDSLFIDVSIDAVSSEKSLELSSQIPCIYSSIGFHPYSAEQYGPKTSQTYSAYLYRKEKIAAVGEVGLDCKASIPLDRQEKIFREFIGLALAAGLPLVVHNRLDSQRILDILDDHYSSYASVVFHCFSQDKAFASRVLDKNGTISFSLNVLRHNSAGSKALSFVPLENMVLETDSPYMRIGGQNSSPLDIEKVYELVSREKKTERGILEQKILENARKVFNI